MIQLAFDFIVLCGVAALAADPRAKKLLAFWLLAHAESQQKAREYRQDRINALRRQHGMETK